MKTQIQMKWMGGSYLWLHCNPLFLLAMILTLAATTDAAPYSIDWFKIAGGGGSSSGGQFTLSGTIGQHDAGGPMTNGNYSLIGGFWAISAVQTPGAPLLRIFLTPTNTAVVAWPAPSTGWNLQTTVNLATPNWVVAPGTPITVGGEKQLVVSPPVGNRFYRLSYP